MNIRKIKIKNVRGISSREISLDIHPNTPTFFVAPNGFGKTSIATAFNSMNRNRIEVQDEDMFQNNPNALPQVEITDETRTVYIANSISNTITDTFSICVINSQVKPKASTRNFGSFSSSTPTLVVEPIVLYKTIPNKSEFTYSFSEMKRVFGTSAGKLLINMNTSIKDSTFVHRFSVIKSDLVRLLQSRNNCKIKSFLIEVNKTKGSTAEVANCNIDTSALLGIDAVNRIIDAFDFLFKGRSINEKLVNIAQLRELYRINEQRISSIISYYDFVSDKNEINEMLSFFNCTWKNIKARKNGTQFVIEFPKANQISNGERDVLCFIGKLFEARNKLRKDKAILIIDEIFDYLDDANIIAVQYFLVKFIGQFKDANKELFPIILTHLDPMFFNTYSFSTKNVVYLDRVTIITNKYKINNLLKDREHCKKQDKALYDRISSNYLHYSIDNTDETIYLQSIGIETPLLSPESFRIAALRELENYKNTREYDPALVCCGLRIYIERFAYGQLSTEEQVVFLTIFKTTDKLAFAKEKGANIPEVHFLLSIIYNEAMHLDPQCQKLNPIAYKLRNKVIQNMISEL
ncbi:hypothetical protein [Dehalobacter sp. TBBPA1]|uniref:hypothetical protein n=1 Tax=Dehalobacter sp. TBBPA1 TaxID=3235037 RepID=UPI0034A1118E